MAWERYIYYQVLHIPQVGWGDRFESLMLDLTSFTYYDAILLMGL